MTTAERTMAREDALARGRELLADIHAILKDAPKRRHLSYRAKLAFLLGGAGSGNFGHAGRPGEIGGSAPDDNAPLGKSHAIKPSVKGKNIGSMDNNANYEVAHDVLGLNSEAEVRDLAESMVQYADEEKFDVTISTEGGGPSDEDLQQGYDDYVENETTNARSEWVDERFDRQEEIRHLWADVQAERTVAEAEQPDPEKNPTFPGDKGYKRQDPAELDEISFEDLTHDLDPSSRFSESERETIRERLRESGGPQLVSRSQLRRDWNEGEGQDYQPSQSFDDWADTERGSSRRGSGEESLKMVFVGSQGTQITREFKHDENGDLVVSHDYFKTYRTGGGIAKDVLRASFDEYEKLGVTKVTVHANIDVGGYAWAKFGFRLTDNPDIDRQIARAERDGKITHEERVMLEDVLTENEGSDTKLWDISDLKHPDTAHLRNGDPKIGAAVLIGSDWTGEIELSDKVAMARLRGYIAETKPEKPAPVKGTTADTERANQANVAAANRNAANRAKADWIAQESERRPDATVAQLEKSYRANREAELEAADRRRADTQAGRITDVAQAYDKAHREDDIRTEANRASEAARQQSIRDDKRAIDEGYAYERRAMGTETKADRALLKAAETRDPYETWAQRDARLIREGNARNTAMRPAKTTTVDRDLAAARRHLDEIRALKPTWSGKTGRDADEQREALAHQERTTTERVRMLEDQKAQAANRKRLGLAPLNMADDPPTPPMPTPPSDNLGGGSREMFYENEDGTRGDRDLWRDLLGEDFPDDEPPKPPTPPKKHALTYREKLAFLLGGEGSGNFGHAGRPGEVGGSAPAGEGGGEAKEEGPAAKRFREEREERNRGIENARKQIDEQQQRIAALPEGDPERQNLVRENRQLGREITDLLQKQQAADMFGPPKELPPPPPRPQIAPVDMDTLTPTETKLLGSEEKGINGSYRVKADGPNGEHVLQYKPDSQQQRVPFEGLDYKDGWPTDRELAAYKVDQALGYDLITDTQRVTSFEHGPGSAHLWAEGTQAAMQGHVAWDAVPAKSWYQMGALDIMIGNRDRHVGNFLISDSGMLTAVDHGYAFHKDPNNSLIIESSARQPVDRKIPASERKAMADKIRSTDWDKVLKPHLRYPTVDAFKERAAKVADAIEQGKLGEMWSQVDPRSRTSARESPRGSADSRGPSSGGPSSGVPWGAD